MKTFVTYCVRCMRGCELTISYDEKTVKVEDVETVVVEKGEKSE